MNADSQILTGEIIGDDISAIMAAMKNNSTLRGAVNPDNKLKSMSLTLDSTSKWSVTADSYLTALNDADSTIYYDARVNGWLNGKTVTLKDGGKLTLKKIVGTVTNLRCCHKPIIAIRRGVGTKHNVPTPFLRLIY